MQENNKPNRICVGHIAGVHGVKGLVRINSYTEKPMNIGAYGSVTDEGGKRMFELEVQRMAKMQVLARIKGISDRNAAEALRGTNIYVQRDELHQTSDEEFYYGDLEGLCVERVDGDFLGKVVSVQDFGAGGMIEVSLNDCETIFIPFTKEVIVKVDLTAGRLLIDPPQGLFETKNSREEKH